MADVLIGVAMLLLGAALMTWRARLAGFAPAWGLLGILAILLGVLFLAASAAR